MKRSLPALFAGAMFAVGLVLGGMTQPAKVIGFLNFTGDWDPSLALVLGGALAVYSVLSRVFLRRSAPLFAPTFHLPSRRDIDLRLILGAAIFGIGWGLGGYCPGPGLVSFSQGAEPMVFVAAMVAGMYAERWVGKRRRESRGSG